MNAKEKKNFVRSKVANCILSIDKSGSGANYARYCWKVGAATHQSESIVVCKACFCNTYCVSSSQVDIIASSIKAGVCNTERR